MDTSAWIRVRLLRIKFFKEEKGVRDEKARATLFSHQDYYGNILAAKDLQTNACCSPGTFRLT